MLHLEPLGTGRILPAFVVGYELSEETRDALERFEHAPDWLLILDQQAGGLGMSYPTVVGAVLRLEANLAHFADGGRLVRGFKAMAEDPELAVLRREFPVLRELVCTFGDPYDRSALDAFHGLVSRHLRCPAFASGIEAFVRCAACDPLQYFAGWQVFSCVRRDGFTLPEVYRGRRDVVDQWVLNAHGSALRLTDEVLFAPPSTGTLAEVGRAMGDGGPPAVFLLWENSD